jgi:hypothetical protein
MKPEHTNPFKTPRGRNCFVMMRYRTGKAFQKIEQIIRDTLGDHRIHAAMARDGNIAQHNLLWENVCAYMDNCEYGIVVFDNITDFRPGEARANPNLCLELGYMLALERRCLVLVDTANNAPNMDAIFSDLQGYLVAYFDSTKLDKTLTPVIKNWIHQQTLISPIVEGFALMFPKTKLAARIADRQREKIMFANHIYDQWKEDGMPRSLLLDSGTTAAAMAEVILLNAGAFEGIHIFTNNLLVAILLSSNSRLLCHVLPGLVDDNFAGMFLADPNEALANCDAEVAILGCTGFCLETGPMANSKKNRDLKAAALKMCKKVYIGFTSDKLLARYTPGKSDNGTPVYSSASVWKKVMESNVELLVTDWRASKDCRRSIKSKKHYNGKWFFVGEQ